MRLVIEKHDFQNLSKATRDELMRVLVGGEEPATRMAVNGAPVKRPRFRWRRPVDLTPELTAKLMHGLSDSHKDRLKMFAETGGRVSMRDLMDQMGDHDVRALSHFEGAITRRLRRIVGDREKVAYLIGWDYESTQWNDDTTEIVDGTYYVTEPTVQALRSYFELD